MPPFWLPMPRKSGPDARETSAPPEGETTAGTVTEEGLTVRAPASARYLRFVRNWLRCVVQSDPPVEFVAQLPCQPHTHVIVWSRCLYWSMT